MVTVKTGDILEATENIIGHQVNCCGAAGGLAFAMFNAFPKAEDEYFKGIATPPRVHLLGTVQYAAITNDQKVANIFGQFYPGADYRPDALSSALEQLGNDARENDWTVALPFYLSCGICGGDWSEVYDIIERTMEGVDCVLYRRVGD